MINLLLNQEWGLANWETHLTIFIDPLISYVCIFMKQNIHIKVLLKFIFLFLFGIFIIFEAISVMRTAPFKFCI